jgi:alpha-tubulin suppressor-like RCC1 family protein
MSARSCNRMGRERMRRTIAGLALLALTLSSVLASAPITAADETGYLQVSAGGLHTCALRLDGTAVCWGGNSYGQATPPDGTFMQISAGAYHTCGVRSNGAVECWGHNGAGQAVDKAGPFTQVSAGGWHTCAVRQSNGTIACWGAGTTNWNENMEFGQSMPPGGSFIMVTAGDAHTCGVRTDGNLACWGEESWLKTVPPTVLATQVSAGGEHSAAAKGDGAIACWGQNLYGQCKPQDGAFLQVSAGGNHTCGLKSDQTVACWGYNFYGQVKNTPQTGAYKQIDSGWGHACAITNTDAVVCWGRNDHGQARVPVVGGPGVSFDFGGFYPPVAPEPELNVARAGSSVPLKFTLGGAQGLKVIEAGYPASASLDCRTMDPSDNLQPTQAAGKSGLTYDPSSDQYTYVWKSEKAWAGTCRYLSLRLTDGTEHLAAFSFR